MGLYHYGRPGEVNRGVEVLERSLAINPNLINAANWLQNAYISAGRPADALAVLQDLVARDPLYRPGVSNLVFLYGRMDRLDEAKALLEATRPYLSIDATIAQLEANVSLDEGKAAEALRTTEGMVKLYPNDRVLRVFHSWALRDTHQYERLAEEGYQGWRVWGLQQLGRTEEAAMLAWKVGPGEDIVWLLEFLNAAGRSDELVAYLEQQWSSLGDFEAAYPANGYSGYPEMNAVALAYRRAGNQDGFDDAMRRTRNAHDSLAAQGLHHPRFWLNEAAWYALAGQPQESLKHLAAAVDGGMVVSERIADALPYFHDLEGDPDYEAIQARMLEHINAERRALGLDPVEA